MSLQRLAIIVVLLAASVGLAWSNPSMTDYLQFVERELNKAMSRTNTAASTREQQFIRQVFASQSQKILQDVVLPHTRRKNFGLASLYNTTVMETNVVVLGVAGQFIPLQGVEEATIKIGRLAF